MALYGPVYDLLLYACESLLKLISGVASAFFLVILLNPVINFLTCKHPALGALVGIATVLFFLYLTLKFTKKTAKYLKVIMLSFYTLGFVSFFGFYYISVFLGGEYWFILPMYAVLSVIAILYSKFNSKRVEPVVTVEYPNPHFIPDEEESIQDLLDIKSQVKHFSKIVINNYSSHRLVVGLEGEWGAGKTTFLKHCYSIWDSDPKVEYMTFCAFKCHDDNFLEAFIEQLELFLRELLPEEDLKNDLRSLFDSMSVKWTFKIPFTDIEISSPFKYKNDVRAERLRQMINALGKRLVVVIDDMDRVGIEQIREISRIVRYSSIFETTTFILCYDLSNLVSTSSDLRKTRQTGFQEVFDSKDQKNEMTSNIYSEEDIDNKNISKFLEKIINVKYVLVHSPENLTKLLDHLIEKYDK